MHDLDKLGQYMVATIAVGVVNWQGPAGELHAGGERTLVQRSYYLPPPSDQRGTHVLVA